MAAAVETAPQTAIKAEPKATPTDYDELCEKLRELSTLGGIRCTYEMTLRQVNLGFSG